MTEQTTSFCTLTDDGWAWMCSPLHTDGDADHIRPDTDAFYSAAAGDAADLFGDTQGYTVGSAARLRELAPINLDAAAHPCEGGRCPDPEAHAEGAHDL